MNPALSSTTPKTLQALLDAFSRTPYRPVRNGNPSTERLDRTWHARRVPGHPLAGRNAGRVLRARRRRHADMARQGHARQIFWRWVASWGVMLRSPADLWARCIGLQLAAAVCASAHGRNDQEETGYLFAMEAADPMERRECTKASHGAVSGIVEIVNASNEPWVIWCDLNAEGDALREAIPGAVESGA